MDINFSEREIQNYIWDKRNSWSELIAPIDNWPLNSFKSKAEILGLNADKLLKNIFMNRLKSIYDNFEYVDLLGVEVHLKKDGDSTIRADFLGSINDPCGFVVIELKKGKSTERETFTELLAYSAHLGHEFPTLSKDDILLIVIAPFETRSLREAFVQSFVFERKRLIGLIPTFENPLDITTLKLKLFIPENGDFISLAKSSFHKKNFDIYQIAWNDDSNVWNPIDRKNSPDEYQKANMNRISSYAAQLMEAKQIHGFAFTTQDLSNCFSIPNVLLVAGFNPYKIAHTKICIKENIKLEESWDMEIAMESIIPGLGGSLNANNCKKYLTEFENSWNSNILKIALTAFNDMIYTTSKAPSIDSCSSMTFHDYENNFLESGLCNYFDIRTTGILRELFFEMMKIDYKFWRENESSHPFYGDLYKDAVTSLHSHYLFKIFLQRMFYDDEYST